MVRLGLPARRRGDTSEEEMSRPLTPEQVTPQCLGTVYVPEQLRYTGRSKSGFERHHVKRQCKRRGHYASYCKTHAAYSEEGRAALAQTEQKRK
jgi:hypothetical protein